MAATRAQLCGMVHVSMRVLLLESLTLRLLEDQVGVLGLKPYRPCSTKAPSSSWTAMRGRPLVTLIWLTGPRPVRTCTRQRCSSMLGTHKLAYAGSEKHIL